VRTRNGIGRFVAGAGRSGPSDFRKLVLELGHVRTRSSLGGVDFSERGLDGCDRQRGSTTPSTPTCEGGPVIAGGPTAGPARNTAAAKIGGRIFGDHGRAGQGPSATSAAAQPNLRRTTRPPTTAAGVGHAATGRTGSSRPLARRSQAMQIGAEGKAESSIRRINLLFLNRRC